MDIPIDGQLYTLSAGHTPKVACYFTPHKKMQYLRVVRHENIFVFAFAGIQEAKT